ncbi:MAG: LysR family transcriptional regulator [Rhodospirillaceae bacterium]|nr:MAG: LysR family transcriptional regulator [Rhodospirillaceae bacterium]
MSINRLQRRLPPLNALLAFEAAGRLGNFTAAGRELNITQAAISRHIRTLEGHLGMLLFTREHRAVQLTPDGARFHQSVTTSLEQIASEAAELKRKADRDAVTIGSTIAFATFWLMPLLNEFRALEPGIDFRLMASDTPFHLAGEDIDIAVKYGSGDWPGLDARLLFHDEIFPVCSPDFLVRHPNAAELPHLPVQPLLHLDNVDPTWLTWQGWFENAGLAAEAMTAARGVKWQIFNNYSLLIQAAADGHGIALGWRYFVDALLESGQLVRPVKDSVRTGYGFYLVTARGRDITPPARRLMTWLHEQVPPGETPVAASAPSYAEVP